MANSIKKRGQKILRKFSRATIRASEEGKEHIKDNLIGRFSHIENIKLLIFEWVLLASALIMLAVTQAFWYGRSYAEDAFVSGGTYIEATVGEVKTMNPLFATTSSEKVLSKLLFATLSTIDYSGHPNNGLASSITPNEDGRVWTVKLKEGLTWSDGEPITNQDVIFTANLIKNPLVNTIYNTNLANVKVSEDENRRIVFTLPTSYADFISALNIPIVPEHILGEVDPKNLIENDFSSAPITSGAFSFNAMQPIPNSHESIFYLSANPDYYGGSPLLNTFAIHTYDDKKSIIKAVNSGTVTATAELSGNDIKEVSSEQFNQKSSLLNSGAFIFFNTRNNSLSNTELRAAIRQGINLAKVRESAPDTGEINYPLVDSQISLTNYPGIPGYDLEAAKAKIQELLGDTPLHLDLATVNTGYLPDVAESIAEELRGLGIEVEVSKYEEGKEFINEIISKRSYDILVYEVELGADPDLLPYYHSSQASTVGLNLSNYRNALVDDLLLGARDTLDEEVRVKKYEKFLEYWVTDVPAIGVYRPNLTYFYNKNVRTFGNNVRLVTALDRFVDVDDWAVNKATKNKTP